MAKADLTFPLAGVHGRLNAESTSYCYQRYGRTVVSSYPKRRDPSTISEHQRTLNTRFQQAVYAAQEELADAVRRAYWQAQFDAQPAPRRYKVLRNFVIAQLNR